MANKEGNKPTMLVLGGHKMSRFLHPPIRILKWRTAFIIRDLSVFTKDRPCWLSLKACWVKLVRASMCAIMSSRPTEGTNGGQMIVPVENRTCPPGLQEREL